MLYCYIFGLLKEKEKKKDEYRGFSFDLFSVKIFLVSLEFFQIFYGVISRNNDIRKRKLYKKIKSGCILHI